MRGCRRGPDFSAFISLERKRTGQVAEKVQFLEESLLWKNVKRPAGESADLFGSPGRFKTGLGRMGKGISPPDPGYFVKPGVPAMAR